MSLAYRHLCQGICPHGLQQTDRWTTTGGIEIERSALDTPRNGIVLTRYSSGKRYFANQTAGMAFKVVLSGRELFEIDGGLH